MAIPASTRIRARFSRRLTQLSCSSGTPQERLEIQTTRVRRASYNSDFASSSEIHYGKKQQEQNWARLHHEGAPDSFARISFHLVAKGKSWDWTADGYHGLP